MGMVDDGLTVQKCSTETVKINSIINSFIESKKLKLSARKCHRIHVQNKKLRKQNECPEIEIHEEIMSSSSGAFVQGNLCPNPL